MAALHITGQILLGPDEVVGDVWVLDGKVTFERPRHADAVTTLSGYVVPGLVDAHCHVGLDRHGAVDADTAEQQILADRAGGTLLLRDAGSPADTRWIDDRDDLPKVIRAGRHVARTRRYIRDYADEIEPDQLVETVRVQARRGDGWVKLVGDWIDREAGDLTPCWPADVAAQAIAAAHEEGARVTAHCFGEQSLHELAAAGIDCIEHATGLDPESTAIFAERGIDIVPTLINIATFPEIAAPAAEKFPTYHRHMLDLHARRHRTIADAHEAGVPIHVGTDAGGSLAHGLVVDEMEELVRAGFTRAKALDAGTWASRAWLGRDAITEGADADLLVLTDDPRLDLGALRDPIATILRGARY